jgi:hypothetical protein
MMSLRNHDTFGNQDALLLNYGLGAKYFVADALALRLDARHLLSFDNNQHSHGELSFGVNYYFGKGTAAPSPSVEARLAAAAPADAAHATITPVEVLSPEAVKIQSRASASAPVHAEQSAPVALQPEKAIAREPVAGPVPMLLAVQPQPAPTHAACLSTEVTGIAMGAKGLDIAISGAFSDYKVMTLANPTRLSIDIYTGVNRTGTKKIKMNSRGVTNVRLGDYPYKTRVVLDFAADKLPRYQVVRTGSGLKVLFDKPATRSR